MTFFDIKFAAFGIKVAHCKKYENKNACSRWVEQAGFWENLAGMGAMHRGIRFPADKAVVDSRLQMLCGFALQQ